MERERRRTAWHRAAFARHITRVPDDFPEPRSAGWWVFFGSWSEALDELRVGEAEFDAASKRVSRDPPSHPNKHLRALLEAIEHARRAGVAAPDDREQAERDSRDCPHCGGGGLASRDHHHPGRGRYAVTYYCLCPLGRWHKGRHDRDPKAPRLRDLAHCPELQHREGDRPDPRHLEIGDWFAARKRATLEGRPLPPTPQVVLDLERDFAARKRPVPGKAATPPGRRRTPTPTEPKP